MKNLALQHIQAMQPYSPPLDGRSAFDGLLLDFNERTLQPSETILFALKQFMDNPKLQIYPEYFDLTEKIAAYAGANDDQIMITNGTDQAIDVIFRTFAGINDKAVIPEPSFAMFGQSARVNGHRIVNPLYKKDSLAFPIQDILEAIDDEVKLVVVCNPNSPTGTLVPIGYIERIAKRASNAIVYVDEAYFEFSGVTAIGLIQEYPNIIVSRTFSKAFGLASLRVGYVVARREYIAEMLKVRGPYDVNQVACCAAAAALSDTSAAISYAREVMDKAKPIVEKFFTESKIAFYPSAGNFILFKPDNPGQVAEILRKNGILIRPQNKPNIQGTLRLTIGTVLQMRTFIDVYTASITKNKEINNGTRQ